jgi:two-component system, cell cycle sensor histidine kinase and response regulator CckA
MANVPPPSTDSVPAQEDSTSFWKPKTILLIEDEPVVGEVLRLLLESEGYLVFWAESQEKAENLWLKNRATIDLLLTDISLSSRDRGTYLAERFKKEKPELEVIFTSGLPAELLGPTLFEQGVNYLQKPIFPRDLWDTVASKFTKRSAEG